VAARRRSRGQVAQGQPPSPAQRTISVETFEAFAGPLPAPETLAKYDAIVPGMAERRLRTFEQQAEHRMGLEKHVLRWDVIRSNVGLLAAFVFGVLVLAAAVYLIVNGYSTEGLIAIVSEFVTYGLAFLYSSETRRRERNRKAGR
jgi:uncharacterized membrane protein